MVQAASGKGDVTGYRADLRARYGLAGLAVLTGLLAGFLAVGFRWLLDAVNALFRGHLAAAVQAVHPALFVLVPAAGGLVVAVLVQYGASEAKGHGVPEVMEAVARRSGRMRLRVVFIKALASAVTIGSGGSVGREGPIVQMGSALGSQVGQIFRQGDRVIRTLVACGAAGGMAATFNAPIAGTLFATELILGEFTARTLSVVVLAAVAADVVAGLYLGSAPAFQVPQYQFVHPVELAAYAVLGIAAALAARLFIAVLYRLEDAWDRLRIPRLAKPAAGGAVIGALGLYLPHLLGVGYEAVDGALHGRLEPGLLALLVLLKPLATSITLASGGSGGVFAPSLFIGAMLGGLVGHGAVALLPGLTAAPGAYALVGMGAVFAGVSLAPITSIITLFELTRDYRIILPLMAACVISSLVSSSLGRHSIYTLKLHRRGVDLEAGRDLAVLRALTVEHAMTREVVSVPAGATVAEVVRLMQESRHNGFPVVDDGGRLRGVITLDDIRSLPVEGRLQRRVQEVMSPNPAVAYPNESLAETMERLGRLNVGRLPVIAGDGQHRVVGVITRSDILGAYNRALAAE